MIALGLIFFKQVASEGECTSDDSIVITTALAVLFKDGSISSFSITQSTPVFRYLFFDDFSRLKKGKDNFLFFACFYGRFLSTKIVIAKPKAIAIIIAAAAAPMYISVGGNAVSGSGDGVAAAGSTAKAVVACDP
jgi:hypothetical protein